MNLSLSRTKTLVIILVFAVVLVAGVRLYHHFHKTTGSSTIDAACERAAEYHKNNTGPLVELTADDAVCQSRTEIKPAT